MHCRIRAAIAARGHIGRDGNFFVCNTPTCGSLFLSRKRILVQMKIDQMQKMLLCTSEL